MRQPAPAPQMRAPAPPMRPIPPMHMPPPMQAAPAPRAELPGWTPEPPVEEDDFAQVAAQARLGVQRNVVDEATRRKKIRLVTACGLAVAVAGVIVFLIETFYDPEARARENAIAEEVSRMAEQQKVTDNLTLIEIEIENAITNNDLATARIELSKLIERSPQHPRREFLQTSIDRAAELQKFAAQSQPAEKAQAPAPEAAAKAATPATPERTAERATVRVPARAPERAPPARTVRDTATPASRTYGAPISEPPPPRAIALDAPINSSPTTPSARRDNNFGGRTVEASDSAVGRGSPPAAAPSSGSTALPVPTVAAPAPAPPPPVDVTPAKIVRRVTPLVGADVPRKASGHVVVNFDIGDNGRVSNVEVVESTPPGVFDDAALTAVRKWVYEPRKENGVAVASQARARLVFEAAN
jgi:TonB family protein